jgi:hypothetical protein
MGYLLGLICVGALCVFPLTGCSETAGDGGGGGDGGTGGIGGDGGAAGGNTASLVTVVTSWDPEMGVTGSLEGVEVCETDTTNCEMTDINGNVTLTPVIDEETSYTFDKEGFGPYLEPMVVSEDGAAAYGMATDARINDMYDLVMSPYPMVGTGSVFIELNDGLAGATFVLTGGEGKAFYWDEDQNWDASLTATTSTAGGGFVEVSPGEYEVEVGGTAENCEVIGRGGWPRDAANTVGFPIQEGYLTRARLDCDDAP